MMSNKHKILTAGFILLSGYTLYGTTQLSLGGGPCSAGIEILILFPLWVISSICQFLILRSIFRATNTMIEAALSLACTFFWAWPVIEFAKDDFTGVLLFLSPFLAASLLISIRAFIRERPKET